ncbi:unnamed protein product [Gongylonema pulchrum]|uniref:NET domain-containing protein n=1 Tax=Gongylonema pulchrum TaxID=637853 RepID=A0A183E7C1_9BILA|nr:unnamed protein product [Gongylonema pulchrum]
MTGESPGPEWTMASGACRDNAEEEQGSKPMSRSAMLELVREIHKLPEDELGAVVQIVQSGEQLPQSSADKVEIHMESLKPTTLHALKAFVASCRKKGAQTPGTGDDEDMEDDESGSELDETSDSEPSFFDEEDDLMSDSSAFDLPDIV